MEPGQQAAYEYFNLHSISTLEAYQRGAFGGGSLMELIKPQELQVLKQRDPGEYSRLMNKFGHLLRFPLPQQNHPGSPSAPGGNPEPRTPQQQQGQRLSGHHGSRTGGSGTPQRRHGFQPPHAPTPPPAAPHFHSSNQADRPTRSQRPSRRVSVPTGEARTGRGHRPRRESQDRRRHGR